MSDPFSKIKRSSIMAGISGAGTKPEIKVRKYLFARGFRYRKNDQRLPGKPDIVLPKYRSVIFVHGCFWHHHENCARSLLPITNREFWENKIMANAKRDQINTAKLVNLGWRIHIIWQCEIKNKNLFEATMNSLIQRLSRL